MPRILLDGIGWLLLQLSVQLSTTKPAEIILASTTLRNWFHYPVCALFQRVISLQIASCITCLHGAPCWVARKCLRCIRNVIVIPCIFLWWHIGAYYTDTIRRVNTAGGATYYTLMVLLIDWTITSGSLLEQCSRSDWWGWQAANMIDLLHSKLMKTLFYLFAICSNHTTHVRSVSICHPVAAWDIRDVTRWLKISPMPFSTQWAATVTRGCSRKTNVTPCQEWRRRSLSPVLLCAWCSQPAKHAHYDFPWSDESFWSACMGKFDVGGCHNYIQQYVQSRLTYIWKKKNPRWRLCGLLLISFLLVCFINTQHAHNSCFTVSDVILWRHRLVTERITDVGSG